MSLLVSVAAVAVGIASHSLYFNHGEHQTLALRYIQAFVAVFITTVVVIHRVQDIPAVLALTITAKFASLYLTGLYTSLLVWRLFFNPLNKFPGPFAARLTHFHFTLSNRGLDRHRTLQKLHRIYGDFVRIGPNDLSIIDPRGVVVAYGPQSRCTKAPWYGMDGHYNSLQTTRDRADHDRRRRVWIPAFSDKALRGYEARIQTYNDLLIKQLDARVGQPMNMVDWFNYYSFDVMGDLGFGKSFDSLAQGDMHWATQILTQGLGAFGLDMPDWLFRLLFDIPGLAGEYKSFVKFACQQLDKRMQRQSKTDTPDIAHVLIDHFEKNAGDKREALLFLQVDTRLIIQAGSDTTTSALIHMFFYIASDPQKQDEIRREVKAAYSDGKAQALQDAPLLNGTISEALRLHPPVSSGLLRVTPSEGINIGEVFIPGDAVIRFPQYVMGHDEANYTHAETFIPERWSSQPELVKNRDAYAPFSVGPYNCIGKNLAYLELRLLTTQLLTKFNVALAPGEDGTSLLTKSQDHFTLHLAPLRLVFTRRED